MFDRWQKILATRRFTRQISSIYDTSPLHLVDAPLCIVSMVSTTDLPMYLLAIQSFYSLIRRGKVVALVKEGLRKSGSRGTSFWSKPNGGQRAHLEQTLQKHIPGIEIVDVDRIPLGSCPSGGTWERILYVLDRSEREYVIQLDSDTLTIGPDIPEVRECIVENRSFTLGGGPAASGQQIVPIPEAAASAYPADTWIGSVAQRRMAEYPGASMQRYVRGSSAFAGFARGGFSRDEIEQFSAQMSKLLGERWAEWGTEQCASNFAVANTPGALVLPYPDYANFRPASIQAEARFLHFLGTARFKKGHYARVGRQVIDRLLSQQAG